MSIGPLRRMNYHGAPYRQPVALPDPISTFMPALRPRHYASFWLALAGGVGGLIALSVATVDTASVNLEDVFIVLGSLLVPTLYVYYLDQRNMFLEPRGRTLVLTFLLGALLGCPIAFILEIVLGAGTGAPGPALLTGLIEEFSKGLALLWLLRRKHHTLSFEMDGIILGAAAGMGFAALEDMEYGALAFSHGIHAVVATVWLRQILGPFGHGTWTAILGGAIWRAKGDGRPRITASVIGAYLLVAALHGAFDWDPVPGLASLLWIAAVGAVGLIILRSMVHQALAQERERVQGGTASQPAESAP